MTWSNTDGLYIKFGQEEAVVNPGGEVSPTGDGLMVSFELAYTDFTSATAGAVIVMDNVVIPDDAQIDKVELIVHTAFDSSGDGFIFNMGLIDQDRSTEIDFDGLISTEVQADIDAAGDTVTYVVGHADVGALVGTVLTNSGLVCIDYDTAAPTAGVALVRIYFHIP